MDRSEFTSRLKGMRQLKKPTFTDGLSQEQLADAEFLDAFARVTQALSLRFDASTREWDAVKKTGCKTFCVCLSPFHSTKGRLNHVDLGKTSDGADPTSWPDLGRWMEGYHDWLWGVAKQLETRPAVVWLDYEYGRQYRAEQLRRLLSLLATMCWEIIPNCSVVWYRRGHVVRQEGGRSKGLFIDGATIPPGTLGDPFWQVELYRPDDDRLQCETVLEAFTRQHGSPVLPVTKGTACLSVGCGYVDRPGGKEFVLEPTTHLDRSAELGRQAYATGADPWAWDAIKQVYLWPEPGRAPYDHVAVFFEAGQVDQS